MLREKPCHWNRRFHSFVSCPYRSCCGFTVLNTLSFAIPTAFTVDYLFGDTLRAGFRCLSKPKRVNTTETEGCEFEENQDATFILFGVLFTCTVIFYLLNSILKGNRSSFIRINIKVLYVLSVFLFLMTFLPWFLEVFLRVQNGPSFCINGFLLLGSVFLWLGFPPLRNMASIILVEYAYVFVTKWRLYKSPLLFLSYSEETFYNALLVSGILLWMAPFIGLFQLVAVHTYTR